MKDFRWADLVNPNIRKIELACDKCKYFLTGHPICETCDAPVWITEFIPDVGLATYQLNESEYDT